MALLFMDGFEGRDVTYKYEASSSGYGGMGTGPATVWEVGRFTGTAFSGFNYASQGPPYMTKFITPSNIITLGVAVNHSNPAVLVHLIRFFSDSAASLQITIRFNSGKLELLRGGTSLAFSPANIILANSWGYVEAQVKVDPTVGSVIVKYNGVTVINFSGNTKSGGTSSLIDTFQLYFDGGQKITVDDMYVLNDIGSTPHNTFLGDSRVAAVVPNAAGSSTNFTPSSGANYAAVDEAPPSGADYVQASTSGSKDLYGMSDISNATSIYGVQTNILATKTDSGDVSIYPLMKVGASEYRGPSLPMTASWQMAHDLRQTNPSTSSLWTESDVNGFESGVEVV
jgi:hypothetical protein